MADTLDQLVLEFLQYGQRPFIGSDAVNRLHDVIVSLTSGAVNPPLDNLGDNHTYWLARLIQYLRDNTPPVTPCPNLGPELVLAGASYVGFGAVQFNLTVTPGASYQVTPGENNIEVTDGLGDAFIYNSFATPVIITPGFSPLTFIKDPGVNGDPVLASVKQIL